MVGKFRMVVIVIGTMMFKITVMVSSMMMIIRIVVLIKVKMRMITKEKLK